FQNITTDQGLSSNDITCFYKDREGFLWIGTHFGLNRYDGNTVQTFYHNSQDPNSLSGNDIVDIVQDKQNIFWIATKDGGLTRYDPSQFQGNQFTEFSNDPSNKKSIATNRLNCLYDYNDDFLLIGAEVCTGMFMNKKNYQFSYLHFNAFGEMILKPELSSLIPGEATNWVHHISGDESSLYFSFLIGGYVFKTERSSGKVIRTNQQQVTLAFSIPSFATDGERVWLASWTHGLYVQEGFFTDIINIPSQKLVMNVNDEIQSVLVFDKNFVLAGSKSTGLYIVNKNDFTYSNLQHIRADEFSIASNKINCIFKDCEGILWIGTSNGVSKYNPSIWQFRAQPLSESWNNQLQHFSTYIDDSGTVRVCTNAGIYKKNKDQSSFRLVTYRWKKEPVSPTFIYRYHDDHYMCTESYLFRYEPLSENIYSLPLHQEKYNIKLPDFNPHIQFRSAIADTVNNHPLIILSVLGDGFGIYCPSDSIITLMIKMNSVPQSLGNNLVHTIIKDHTGNIWAGTAGGLFRWNKSYPAINDFTSFLNIPGDDDAISGNNISGIYADDLSQAGQNILWITTLGNGLNEFNGKIFNHYYTQTPAGNNMLGIYADQQHRLWIPTPRGFEVFDPVLKKFDEIIVSNPDWILKYPTRLVINKNGSFSYGAGNYLVTFYPDSFQFKTARPKVYLTDFKIMDQSIFQTPAFSNLTFPYNKNFITINFSSLQFDLGTDVRFRYQLSGLDDQWNNLEKESRVTFMSLPPGKYSLMVSVSDLRGNWTDPSSLISFRILQPYWQQWWFYLGSGILIVSITWLVIQFRLKQLAKLQSVRNKIANDLHDDIGSALSTISIYSEVAKMKSDKSKGDELNEVLQKISSTSQEMQENMNYIVWSIQPRNDRFDQILLRMKRYAIDMLQSKNIAVSFTLEEQLNSLKLPQEKRKELFLIFREAIHNITKYSNCSAVSIIFRTEGNKIIMEISDNGIGFRKDDVISGNGLHTMKERSHTLKGDLKITSQLESGTKMILTFPS
ncbi:MAG: two-component regulator propeller domain-containing protein, partial [Chitinophagales bacterium]